MRSLRRRAPDQGAEPRHARDRMFDEQSAGSERALQRIRRRRQVSVAAREQRHGHTQARESKASAHSAALPAAAAPAWFAPAPDRPASTPDAGTCSRSIAARCLRRTHSIPQPAPPPPGPAHPSAAIPEFWRRTVLARCRQASPHRPAAVRSAPAARTTRRARARWCIDSCPSTSRMSARSVSSTPAASKVSVEKPGQSGSAIVCLTASACNGASPR